VPGFAWGTLTAMAQAGIKYFSLAPNTFDRIGTLMREWQDKPFWAVSPSGRERILVWVPWDGYSLSHGEIKIPDSDFPRKYQDRMDAVNFPYDISYVRWAGRGDNAEPDPRICEFVKGWNEEYEWPKFAIASTHEAFFAFEKKHGGVIPEFRGDLTPYWEDGAGSSALETAMNRNAADRLVQAEALGLMTSTRLPRAKIDEAWKNVLLYSEHTWGAAASVADADNENTILQCEFKRNFAVTAGRLSGELLDTPLVEIGVVSANLLGSQRDATSWRKSIAPTQRFYSWVMNNHWGTNYRGYQEGVVAFRYAIRAHDGYDAAACSRFAIGLSQPLLASVAKATPAKRPLLRIDPPDVLALTMKESEDGEGWVVRLFGASGADRRATLTWSSAKAPTLWLSDLSERRVRRIEHEVDVAGWDLVTIRADAEVATTAHEGEG